MRIRAKKVSDLPGLHCALQNAIELEHSTLPPYLTALYSIKDGKNVEIAKLILSIVVEEMLHFALAGNILNAVGGHPSINKPTFIPKYPGQLPMGIGDEPGKPPFIVHLRKLSQEQIKTFMHIEEPEDPIDFKMIAAAEEYHTIGEFYEALKQLIIHLGEGIFAHPSNPQVVGVLPGLIAVTNVTTACTAIDTIVSQGEGSTKSPLDEDGELAHYYKYTEIHKGHALVPNPTAPGGYSYTGAPITLEESGVYDMVDDPSTASLPPNSQARRLSRQFNYTYTSLLNSLHETFNGSPKKIDAAIGLMFSLKLQAQTLMQTPVDPSNPQSKMAGPSYEYQPVE